MNQRKGQGMNTQQTFVVWQHRNGKVQAIGHFAERSLADDYAAYLNRRDTGLAQWSEVRPEWEGKELSVADIFSEPHGSPEERREALASLDALEGSKGL